MKVLVTSDIHIDDFRLYNVEDKSRLKQYYILLDKILQLKGQLGAEEIVLAGDITNKPVNPPYINKVLMDFLKGLSDNFKNVYIILGQHDSYQKTTGKEVSSLVSLLSSWKPNIKYVHDQYIQFGNRTAYFSDFSYAKEVITPQRKVDAFFSHVTLPVGMIKGQEIDETNFELGMFGDIHDHIKVGKCYSIGTPVQVGRTEIKTHTIGVWDTDTNTFERVPINQDNKLSHIRPTTDRDKVGPDLNLNTYFYFKDTTLKTLDEKDLVIDNELNISELIAEAVKSYHLEDIHSEVATKTKYTPVDFAFTPIELELKNLRSCKHFKYNFKEGITYVHGAVGSGKSTVINSIVEILLGKSMKDKVTIGEKEGFMALTLSYAGRTYKIVRNSHSTDQFFIDGVETSAGAVRAIEQEIKDCLPFIEYSDSFFFGANQQEILGELKPKRRVELLSKFYQLDLAEAYFETASVIQTDLTKQIKAEEAGIEEVKNKIVAYKALLDDSLNDFNVEAANSRIKSLEEVLKNYDYNQKLKIDLQTLNISKQNTLNRIKELEELSPKISELSDELNVLRQKAPEMKELKAKYDEFYSEKSKLEWQLQTSKEGSLTKICPTCKRPFDNEHKEEHLAKIKELELRLSQMVAPDIQVYTRWETEGVAKKTQLVSLSSQYEKIDELKGNLVKIDEAISKINIVDLGELNTQEISQEISNLKLLIDRYNRNRQSLNVVETLYSDLKMKEVNLEKDNLLLERWTTYVNLLKFDGQVVTGLLEKLTEKMSNEQFKFKTLSYRKNGNSIPDLSVMFNKAGHWITYEDCSTGQKCLCDTYFISKLITYSGMVMFDEFFANLDDQSLDPLFEIIRTIKSKYIIICSHSNNVTDIDNRISVTLDEKGYSEYAEA